MDASTATAERPLRVAVITGSTREGRVAPAITQWVAAQARSRQDLEVSVLDLVDFDLPGRYPEVPTAAMTAFVGEIERADAFVLVTAEYNRSFPASLKHALDMAYQEWHAKPAGMVSYGCVAGGVFAAEALRGVLTELHMATMRDIVAIDLLDDCVAEDGTPTDGFGADADRMLDQLSWWAHALRDARDSHPYLT